MICQSVLYSKGVPSLSLRPLAGGKAWIYKALRWQLNSSAERGSGYLNFVLFLAHGESQSVLFSSDTISKKQKNKKNIKALISYVQKCEEEQQTHAF